MSNPQNSRPPADAAPRSEHTPLNPQTRAVARYRPPAARQLPVVEPIVQSTTFVLDDALNDAMASGDYRSQFLYTRMGNPTVRALEELLADLHGAQDCVACASGMGAISAAMFGLLEPGRTLLADQQIYGVTRTLAAQFLVPAGRHVRYVDFADTAALAAAVSQLGEGDWLLGETLSNPLVRPLDIAAVARVAHERGARLIVDNTFANPMVCRPLELGADLVVESLSKSIAGHSDVHGGAVLGATSLVARAWNAMFVLGACLDPHAAWLIQRGARTLRVRTAAACEGARALAAHLRRHAAVVTVHAPVDAPTGLTDTGSMLAFVVRGGDAAAHRLLDALTVATAATSLGGVETLASLPYNTSHRTPEARAAVGLEAGTVRVSVGLEAPADLIADFDQALAQSQRD